MRKVMQAVLILTLFLAMGAPLWAGNVDARGAFLKLSSLSGTWTGSAAGEGTAEVEAEVTGEVVHQFRVSAAGTVIMETMNPGSDHEMINMYHIDGEDLVLTHYCAGGNQPTMKLDRAASSAERLVFSFTGGTNLDPAVDEHIHAARIEWGDGGGLRSSWYGYAGGKQAGTMTFQLSRSE